MMARKLDAMPSTTRGGRPIYPWDEWLDGSVWELVQGEDFTCEITSLRNVAGAAARVRGLQIRTRVTDEKVVVIRAKRADSP